MRVQLLDSEVYPRNECLWLLPSIWHLRFSTSARCLHKQARPTPRPWQFLPCLKEAWGIEREGRHEHMASERSSRAKHQKIGRKYKMVEYASSNVSHFIPRSRWSAWQCVRTDPHLWWSIWAPEPLRVGRCLRALDSWSPNFRELFLGQFRSDERDFRLIHSL